MLELQKFEKSDADRLIGWIPDEEFMVQATGPLFKWPPDATQVQKHLEKAEGEKPTVYAFNAVDTRSAEVIGHVEIIWIDYEKSDGMLGPILIGDPGLRSKGYGREMVNLAVDFGFNSIGLDEIYLWVFEFNTGAVKCYEKAGFERCEYKESNFKLGNRSWNGIKMKLEKEVFVEKCRKEI